MKRGDKKKTEIFIGPAGWSYPDWEGIVYPPGKGCDRLLYIARFFNAVELNSSFYRIPSAGMVESWTGRLSTVPGFRLCIKVNGKFTHEREFSDIELEEFVSRFDPLADAGIAGPFLLQFPWSFRDSRSSRDLLERMAPFFEERSAAVEVRHGSWGNPEVPPLLSGLGYAACNIDQPQIGDSLPPQALVTDPETGYIRLHGRNRKDWFRKGAGRDARYDYLYSPAEMKEWADRAREMMGKVSRIFLITNNHFKGQALANAVQLRAMLGKELPEAPASLIRAFSSLRGQAVPPGGEVELGFGD